SLPSRISVEGATFVFNQVNTNINLRTLVQIDIVVVQNISLTVYADPGLTGPPLRVFAAGAGGRVVGQYVESTLLVTPAATAASPRPSFQVQPPAVVPTLAPNAPPPAAATGVAELGCAGDPGELDAQGIPSRLPNRIQFGGN